MTLEMDGDSGDNGLREDYSPGVVLNLERSCDSVSPPSEDWDTTMGENNKEQVHQRVLRSVSRNHMDDRVKKSKFIPEDMGIDSDDENALVIDIDRDNSAEEIRAESSLPERKYLLRPKVSTELPKATMNGLTSIAEPVTVKKPAFAFNIQKKKFQKSFKVASWRSIKHLKKIRSLKNQSRYLSLVPQNVKKEPCIEKKETKMNKSCDPNKCPKCEEEFDDAHSFTLHIREHNTDKSTHICSICCKQLCSASSLDRHMFVHSGERPFRCDVCSASFSTNGNMHRHKKLHHGNAEKQSKSENASRGTKRLVNGEVKESGSRDSFNGAESSNGESNDSDKTASVCDASNMKIRSQGLQKLDDVKTTEELSSKSFPESAESGNADPVKTISSSTLDLGLELNKCLFSDPSVSKVPDDHATDVHSFAHPSKCSQCSSPFRSYLEYEKHSCCPPNTEKGTADQVPRKKGFHDINFIDFSSKKFTLIARTLCEKENREPSCNKLSYKCELCETAFPNDKSLKEHKKSHGNNSWNCSECEVISKSLREMVNHKLSHILPEQVSLPLKEKSNAKIMQAHKETYLNLLGLSKSQTNSIEATKVCSGSSCNNMAYFCPQDATSKMPSECSNDFADIHSIISMTSRTSLADLQASSATALPSSPLHFSPDVTPPPSPVLEGSAELSSEATDNGCLLRFPEGCEDNLELPSTSSKEHTKPSGKRNQLHRCKHCPYTSPDKSTLTRHLRKHSGEHPFRCTLCRCLFTTKANGHRHVKNKHKKSDQEAANFIEYNSDMEKPNSTESGSDGGGEIICKYCGRDFKFPRLLRHHLRSLSNSCSHKPFMCCLCKQGFSTKNNCIRHITNHHPDQKGNAKKLVTANEVASAPSDVHDLSEETSESESHKPETSESENESPKKKIKTEACIVDNVSIHVNIEPLNLAISDTYNCETHTYNGAKSDAEISVAKSLISLREFTPSLNHSTPLQDKPLDLTMSALNLSVKTEPSCCDTPVETESSQILTDDRMCQSFSNSPLQETNRNAKNQVQIQIPDLTSQLPINLSSAAKPVELTNTSIPVLVSKVVPGKNAAANPFLCFPQVVSSSNVLDGKKTAFSLVISAPKVFAESSANNSAEKQKLNQKDKRFHCEFCNRGFTLKSNKERHIKNHHPGHARPPRSRNYIPTLSPPKIQKQQSPLSDRTRDALRVAIISKSTPGVQKAENLNSKAQNSVQAPGITVENNRVTDSANSKPEITDLASVSAVIDTVNCQPFKEFLSQAKDLRHNQDHTKQNNATKSSEKGEKTKKSSYANSPKSIHCNYCMRPFPWESSLSRHLLTHTGAKPHQCSKCPLSFTTKSNRDRHLLRQHKDDSSDKIPGKSYQCPLCPNAYFSTSGKLKKHNCLKHPELPTSNGFGMLDPVSNSLNHATSRLASGGESSLSDDALGSLECHVCSNSFETQHDLLTHLRTVHPMNCGSSRRDSDQDLASCSIKVEPADLEREDTANNISSALGSHSSNHSIKSPQQNHSVSSGGISPSFSSLSKSRNSLLCLLAAAEHVYNPMLQSEMETKSGDKLMLNLHGIEGSGFIQGMQETAAHSPIKMERDLRPVLA